MKTQKKSQVTIFIIITLIIIALVSVFYLLRGTPYMQKFISNEFRTIEDNLEKCAKNASEEAVSKVSSQGGYYQNESDFMENKFPLYYNQGNLKIPSASDLKKSLCMSISKTLPACMNLDKYNSLSIQKGNISCNAVIGAESLNFRFIRYISCDINAVSSF